MTRPLHPLPGAEPGPRFAAGALGLLLLLLLGIGIFSLPWQLDPDPAPAAAAAYPGSALRQPECPAPLAGETVTITVRVVAGELVALCSTHRRPYR